MSAREVNGLGDLVSSLIEGLPAQQLRLYADYWARLAMIEEALGEDSSGDLDGMVEFLAGPAQEITGVEIEAGFRSSLAKEKSFTIAAELLNLGAARKYAHSQFSENRVTVTVARAQPQAELAI